LYKTLTGFLNTFNKFGLAARKTRFKNATLGILLEKIFSNTSNSSMFGDHEPCNNLARKKLDKCYYIKNTIPIQKNLFIRICNVQLCFLQLTKKRYINETAS